jgi:hypothetical protein
METAAHLELKRHIARFLLRLGCTAVATEVNCPISRYRVDVAGYLDRAPWFCSRSLQEGPSLWSTAAERPGSRTRPPEPQTVLIECKQSRADFFRDRQEMEALLDRREMLDQRRRQLEQSRIPALEPHLRQSGTALFTELEQWDYTSSRLPAYRTVMRRIRRLERQIHGQTKFFMIARYRLADRLYIAAPHGLIRRRELPPGWGLLECPRKWLAASPRPGEDEVIPFRETVEAPVLGSDPRRRQRLLRNIAAAATRASLAPRR